MKQKATYLVAALIAAALWTLVPTASALEYTARVLKPFGVLGATAWGISADSQVGSNRISGSDQAALWVDGNSDSVPLHPTEFAYSTALGVHGAHQVGYGGGPATGNRTHALLWNGSADSVIDLHPAGFLSSQGSAIAGSSQVGIAWNDSQSEPHAILWQGTADSFVNLHPAGWDWSHATGVSGNQQVGWAGRFGPPAIHAMLWKGGPDQFVDLNPQGFASTWANGTSGSAQVGRGYGAATGNRIHALLWSDTAPSVVDLHPAGFDDSEATSVAGSFQAGFAGLDGTENAMVWNGSSASAVNLHPYLNALGTTFSSSQAYGVSAKGEVVGFAYDSTNKWQAVVWSPVVPEPNTILLTVGALLLSSLAPRSLRAARHS